METVRTKVTPSVGRVQTCGDEELVYWANFEMLLPKFSAGALARFTSRLSQGIDDSSVFLALSLGIGEKLKGQIGSLQQQERALKAQSENFRAALALRASWMNPAAQLTAPEVKLLLKGQINLIVRNGSLPSVVTGTALEPDAAAAALIALDVFEERSPGREIREKAVNMSLHEMRTILTAS